MVLPLPPGKAVPFPEAFLPAERDDVPPFPCSQAVLPPPVTLHLLGLNTAPGLISKTPAQKTLKDTFSSQ